MLRNAIRSGSATLRSSSRPAVNQLRTLSSSSSKCALKRVHSAKTSSSRVCAQTVITRRCLASSTDFPPHIKVVLPALSPTMEMGTIISWEKKEGDALSEGDLLAEIETDKATMGFETPEEGYLAKILVPAGAKNVPLGKLLCVIVSNQEDIAAFKDYADSGETTTAAAASPTSTPASSATTPVSTPVLSTTKSTPAQSGQRIFISPLAKQLAAVKGIDISQMTGSGPSGRIRASDVLNAGPATVTVQPGVSAAFATASGTDLPLSSMRQTIAKRLTQSKMTIPHYYLTVEIEVNQLLGLREQMNQLLIKDKQPKLSLNDFVIKAAALACKQVPEVNSSWQETHIRQYENVDISLAVNTDAGLITPIVFKAENLGVKQISDQVKQLAAKAREGRLQPAEYQGGTFTISNLGMFGVSKFAAVINPPQAAILAVGSIEQRLLPNTNAKGDSDQYRTASLLSVTLSCDHRVVDGAVGAKWLQHFTQYMNNPFTMVL